MDNLGNDIILRDARIEDSIDLFNWRNHPEIGKYFFDNEEIAYASHEKWFRKKLKDIATKIYICIKKNQKIGVIRFELLNENTATISVSLNPEYLHKGFGKKIIIAGTEKFIASSAGKYRILARIKKENMRSIGAFLKAGYRLNSKTESIVEYVFKKKISGLKTI